jgi:membrane fusion protein (multidrug efflux system)
VAVAQAAALDVERVTREQQLARGTAEVRRAERRRALAQLAADRAATEAAVATLEQEIERRVLRAPTDGKIAEVTALRPGAYVGAGDRLAVVLPEGELRIVAQFDPSALGRLKPGQRARLKLAGFSWLQYGSIRGQVSAVAGELRDGKVRVEVAITDNASSVPLQHGLPGTVEVEVEDVTPFVLVLRATGRGLSSSPTAKQ